MKCGRPEWLFKERRTAISTHRTETDDVGVQGFICPIWAESEGRILSKPTLVALPPKGSEPAEIPLGSLRSVATAGRWLRDLEIKLARRLFGC